MFLFFPYFFVSPVWSFGWFFKMIFCLASFSLFFICIFFFFSPCCCCCYSFYSWWQWNSFLFCFLIFRFLFHPIFLIFFSPFPLCLHYNTNQNPLPCYESTFLRSTHFHTKFALYCPYFFVSFILYFLLCLTLPSSG